MDQYAGQIALVLQGGGALGAYQVGVYEALHDAGLEPDWIIGTSIGAIFERFGWAGCVSGIGVALALAALLAVRLKVPASIPAHAA